MLFAGIARRDITPNRPVPLSGYGFEVETPTFRDGPREDRSSGVHDPISTQALVLSGDDATVGIVAIDLLNVSQEFTAGVWSNLPPDIADELDGVVFAATHNHSAPYMSARLLDVSPLLAIDDEARTVVDDVVAEYEVTVASALAEAVKECEPATLRVGRAENAITPVNRRSTGSADDRPVDPELLVVQVETDSGAEAVLVNFACHPICVSANESQVSADYPGVVRDRIHEWGEEDTTVLFLNGAAGDINPRDRNGKDYTYMEEIGSEVADAALTALESASDVGYDLPVSARRRDVEFPLQSPPPLSELEQRRDRLEKRIDTLDDVDDEEAIHQAKIELLHVREVLNFHDLDDSITVPVQYLEVGPVGLLSVPGEAFVRHGLDFKARAAADYLVVAGYADEYVGLLPTRDEFEGDGYEIPTFKVTTEAIERFRFASFDLMSV